MSRAVDDVVAERVRQVEVEGFDSAHDDQHTEGELAKAAACYATYAHWMTIPAGYVPSVWPSSWSRSWWKPKAARHDIVRAAALLIAEIERIDRAAEKVAA